MNEAIYEADPILYRIELNHQIHFNCSSEQIFRQFCVSRFVLCDTQNFFGLYESSYILNIHLLENGYKGCCNALASKQNRVYIERIDYIKTYLIEEGIGPIRQT